MVLLIGTSIFLLNCSENKHTVGRVVTSYCISDGDTVEISREKLRYDESGSVVGYDCSFTSRLRITRGTVRTVFHRARYNLDSKDPSVYQLTDRISEICTTESGIDSTPFLIREEKLDQYLRTIEKTLLWDSLEVGRVTASYRKGDSSKYAYDRVIGTFKAPGDNFLYRSEMTISEKDSDFASIENNYGKLTPDDPIHQAYLNYFSSNRELKILFPGGTAGEFIDVTAEPRVDIYGFRLYRSKVFF